MFEIMEEHKYLKFPPLFISGTQREAWISLYQFIIFVISSCIIVIFSFLLASKWSFDQLFDIGNVSGYHYSTL